MFQLRSATLSGEYEHVYHGDPAVDTGRPGWRSEFDAALESSDLSRLPLKPGEQPVRFTLRHLSRKEVRACKDVLVRSGLYAGTRLACELALVGADSLLKDNGEAATIERTIQADGFQHADPEVVDLLDEIDDGALVTDIGNRVLSEANTAAKKK